MSSFPPGGNTGIGGTDMFGQEVPSNYLPNIVSLPRYFDGRPGGMPHWVINEAFNRLDELDGTAQVKGDLRPVDDPAYPRRLVPPDRMMFAQVTDQQNPAMPPQELDSQLAWHEVFYDLDDGFLQDNATRSSGTDDPPQTTYDRPAVNLTPPFGLMRYGWDENRTKRYFWVPAPMAYACEITAILGDFPTHTYEVLTVDGSLRPTNLTPLDRWAGIQYNPRPIGSTCLLIVAGSDSSDMHLVAYETPSFISCPNPVSGLFADTASSSLGL